MVAPFPPAIPGLPGAALGPLPAAGPDPFTTPEIPFQLIPPMDQEREPAPPPRQKRPKLPTPTLEQLRSRADLIVEYWARRDTRMNEDYALYRLSRAGYSGTGELVLRNLPYILVEKAAALLGKQKPKIDVIPPRGDLRPEAQQVENYLRYKWTVWGDEWAATLHNSLRRDIGHFLALRGWAALRISYDSEDESLSQDPVRLVPYDPIQVYPSVGSKGLRFVVHRYQSTISELLDEWPEAEALYRDRDDLEELVEVTAYYDDWHHAVWTDEGVIKDVTAHGYGFVPWLIGTGMGAPIRATTQNTSDWVADVGVSIFHGIKDAYKQMNKVLSQLATEVARSANPPIIHYFDPNAPDEPKRLRYDPGQVNFLMYDRERVEPLTLSPNPRDAAPVLDALRDDINMGGLPPILWGAGAGASGYQQSLMADAAEDALYPLVEAMTRLIRLANSRCLELIRDLHDGAVGYVIRDPDSGGWTGGVTLDPLLIETVGTENRVSFKNISPRDRMQMANLAAMLTDKKLIDLDTARDDYLQLEDPERVNEKVLTDLVYLDDGVVKTFVEAALQRTEPEMYQLYLAAQQRQRQAQPPGPPGGPPGAPPGLPPGGPPGAPPGLPPQLMPPIQQAAAQDPMALLLQAAASSAGGAGLQRPAGIPGLGGVLPRPPLAIPGLS